MSSHNPYDDYDAIDPWDDEEDDTGNFEFVEDEYVGTEDPLGDGFELGSQEPDHDKSLPRTMVRPMVVATPPLQVQSQPNKGRRLKRSRRGRRDDGYGPGQAGSGYVNAVSSPPQAQPTYQRERPAARTPRRHRHHFGCLVWFVVLVLAAVGAYWAVAHPIDEKLAFPDAEQRTLSGNLSWSIPTTPCYVLALGSDAREGEEFSRTDTMLLVRIDFWGGKITMLSIPRDTMVEIEGHGTQKINAAYAFGMAGGAVRAVHDLTGVPISHVAVVHFEELAGLVDYLGGVTVNVPQDVYDPNYTGLILDAGMQTLDGDTALAWARTRYGYADGDYQRQENQRILLTAITNRMLSLSPSMIPGLVDELSGLVGTDLRCYNIVPLFIRFKLSNPTIYSASVPSTPQYVDGVSYVVVDRAALSRMMQVIEAGGDPSGLS